MEKFKSLFEPIKIAGIEIKNRIAMAPTGTFYSGIGGVITDQLICHYAARAKGGTGLIIVEHALCSDRYWKGSGIPIFGSINNLPGMRDLASAIKDCGAKAVVQLGIGLGRQTSSIASRTSVVAPSARSLFSRKGSAPDNLRQFENRRGEIPQELSLKEIEQIKDDYRYSVKLVKKAGFNGIEIHGANGYLLSEFMSPEANWRNDIYGGSIRNRTRLALELLNDSKEQGGEKFIVGFRISADEHIPNGRTLQETKNIVPLLEGAGADYIHISSGTAESLSYLVPDKSQVILPEALSIKEICKVPIICPNLHDYDTASHLISKNMIDMMSSSRGLLADPEWPNKLQTGCLDQIKSCKFCNYCFKSLYEGFHISCTQNSFVGWERFNTNYQPPFKS